MRRQNHAASRPFEGPGVTRRIAPFVAAGVLAYLAAPFVRVGGEPWDLVAAGVLILAVIAAIYLVPWSRLPAWVQILPPAAVFVIVALMRNDTGGESSEFTGLLALPLIWFQDSGSEEPRQRWHLDVWVDPSRVEDLIRDAEAAGGRLVTDEYAPSWWVLADADGNLACVCTWQPHA